MYIRQKFYFLFAMAAFSFSAATAFSQDLSEIGEENEGQQVVSEEVTQMETSSADDLKSAPVKQEASGKSEESEELDENWFYNKIIRSVNFKGLQGVASKDVDGVVSSFLGKRFTDELFSEMLDRIYALDFFDDIVPEALPGDAKKNTVAITFTVKEKPLVTRIYVTGNRQLRTTEIKDAVTTKEKDVFIPSKLSIDERAVRNHYLEKGFTNVKVSSRTRETEKGIEITFIVDEGRSTVVKEINFVGNKIVSSRTLKKKIKLKEVSLISKGAYQEQMLEADRQAILTYYGNEGYIDADVVDVTKEVVVNEKKARDELIITFAIQEGSQYTYTGITFIGNRIFKDERLESCIRMKPGTVFNQTKFNEGAMAVADLYYENGYTSNRFQQVPQKDAENRTISYQFMIIENVRSHVENIIVKGNTKTKDYVITREIPLESGDIFSKTKVTSGLRNLYNLQYFSAVVPDIVPGSEENLVDLILSVEEQSTTTIEFGVTFSGVSDPNDLPFALFVKWQDSNVKGTGKSLSASATVSTDTQSVGLSYGSNWFKGLPISYSVSTEFSHANLNTLRNKIDYNGVINDDDYYMDYEQLRWTSGFSVGRRWLPEFAIVNLTGGLNFSVKTNRYDEESWSPVDSSISDYANKWGVTNSVWGAVSLDNRDINYDPTKGWFASQKLTWFGLTPFEDEYFLQTDTKAEKYFTLFSHQFTEKWTFKLILMGYSNLMMQFPAKHTSIGESNQLYIDGMFNGRGWTSIYNDLRGNALWHNSVELRVPIVPGVLSVDAFVDAATVKNEAKDLFTDLSYEDFYFSVGPGARFTIPQFPLRLLFANTFQVKNATVKWDKHWKFVLSFNVVNK